MLRRIFKFNKIHPLPARILINFNKHNFSGKDDEEFWREYSKRKTSEVDRIKALEGQEIIYNKTIHSWKYASNHSLTTDEFLVALRDLKPGEESPFVILDVREDVEFELYKFPLKTKVRLPLRRTGAHFR